MRFLPLALLLGVAYITVNACGQPAEPAGAGQPSVKLDGLSLEDKIKKVQDDPKIPDQYKETYINSLKAQAQTGAKP